ncbi:MAG TPA: selenocysteine protein, partial [Thermoplasmatales archaeon]|nr:selenocysteine protein [Thermoplasmatales archaeon]
MFEIISIANHAIIITLFVFVMMLLVDYFNVLTKGRMQRAVTGGRFRQYTVASFLGVTPGCLGAFMNVSLYVHGLLTFGAMVGGMIA